MMEVSQQLESLTLRDPLAWGITYFDLLEGKKWEINTRRWVVDIYQAVNPWKIERYPTQEPRKVVIEKSTQSGISTLALVKALHLACNWPVRLGYTLPRDQDSLDFVTTRVDPILSASTYLSSKLGQPNSSHAKQIANSYLFFIAMSTEPRMMPLDALYVDEVDLSNPDNLMTVRNRLDASRWKLEYYLSTPTVAGFGIDGMYNNTDMREWTITCPVCNTEQVMVWDTHLKVVGAASNPSKVYYGCEKCGKEITSETIQKGRWVARYPDKAKDYGIGFRINQMLTTSAEDLYRYFRDPTSSLLEFYRKRLGQPYEVGGGSLERDDFLVNCFGEHYDFEPAWDGKSTYYLGADQGNEIQVIVFKKEQGSEQHKIVHIELIGLDDGFDRLGQLIQLYRVKRAVIDGNPNRHAVLKLVKEFPGRVVVADYIEQRDAWKVLKKDPKNKSVITNVNIHRTLGFDALIDSFRKGIWALPGQPPNLPPDVETFIDHLTAIKRDTQVRRTKSGEVQVGVWLKLRPDHLAHASLYAWVANQIDTARGQSKIAIIGKTDDTEPATIEEEEYTPKKETITGITRLLAEVPIEQIDDYLNGVDESENKFPLSYKLGKAKAKYDEEDIEWVMQYLIDDHARLTEKKNRSIIIRG